MAQPRVATSPLRATVLLALALALTACSSDSDSGTAAPPTPTPTPSTAPAAGVPAFLADVARAGLGNKEVASPDSAEPLVALGNTICRGLADGNTYGDAIEIITGNKADVTQAQADTFVRSAVTNLCPQYESLLPG